MFLVGFLVVVTRVVVVVKVVSFVFVLGEHSEVWQCWPLEFCPPTFEMGREVTMLPMMMTRTTSGVDDEGSWPRMRETLPWRLPPRSSETPSLYQSW